MHTLLNSSNLEKLFHVLLLYKEAPKISKYERPLSMDYIGNGDPIHEYARILYTRYLAHGYSKDETSGSR